MPETITTRCPSWARSKHRSLMTRVSGGFRSSGKKSPFTEVAILGYPTVQFKKADSFGFVPRRAAIGEKRPKNRGRMRALCQEMWSLSEADPISRPVGSAGKAGDFHERFQQNRFVSIA